MTQIVAADARLSRTRAGQPIGYTVLTLQRSAFRPFTRDGVIETLPGCFAVTGGIACPDAGGYIVWGLENEPIAESAVDPLPTAQFDALLARIERAIGAALPRFAALVPAPVVQMDTATFEAGVERIAETTQAALRQAQGPLAELVDVLSAIRETTDSLSVLNEGANQVMALAEMRSRLNTILGDNQPAGLRAVQEMSTQPLVSAIDSLRADMGRFVDKVQAGQQADERRLKSVQALDKFLATVEGSGQP